MESTSSDIRLRFQRVPEAKSTKNRLHPDLRSDDVDAEVSRLTALGAHVANEPPNESLVVLTDPERNEFCIMRSRVAR